MLSTIAIVINQRLLLKSSMSEDIYVRLAKSSFRSRFHLSKKDQDYVRDKGLDVIRRHAKEFVQKRLSPPVSQLKNDGIIKDLMEIDSNNTDYNEYKERANKWASESIQQKLESFLPNEGKEHDIFIAGGTSIALEFEDNFIKISDPQMATAQGAYYVATMLFE